jgi:PKD repeat protein
VIFESRAVDVIEDPFDDSQRTRQHVYRRDLGRAQTEAASVGPFGALAAGHGAVASGDGRFIAYFGDQGIFLRDMDTGTTQLVDHRWDDPDDWADGFHQPGLAITPDGRYVAYRSDSSDLVEPGQDDNDGADLYRWDRVTGTTTLVSAADGGSSAVRTTVGRDAAPVMSDDGRRLLFWSYSAAVVPGFEDRNDVPYEPGGTAQVVSSLYWRDVATGQTRLVDGLHGSATRSSNGAVRRALLSADGSMVAFDSSADDLVMAYEGSGGDVYLRDMTVVGDEPALVSSRHDSPVMAGSEESRLRALTPDGRLVAFNSRAPDLLPEDSSSTNDGYVRRFTGTAPDGPVRLVVRSAWWRQANGEPRPADGGTDVQALTPDGRYALVYSESTDLTAPRTDGDSGDLFRADLETGDVVHVTRAGRTGPDADAGLESGSVSADGQAAAFLSDAQNLVYGFVDGVPIGGEDPDGRSGPDAYAWSAQALDAPPRAIAGVRQEGPLTVAFDGSASSDAEGPIAAYAWDFGDGSTGDGAWVTHRYAEPGTYTATLTVTDASGGSDTTTVEAKVYAVLAHGDNGPLELVGIDDQLGCSVRRLGEAVFEACGTFVHVDGTLYGPPGIREGVTPFTPVSQSARSGSGDPGDPHVITTTVQLGEAGPLLTQRDSYVEGRPYYRTRVTLVSEGSFDVATVYRAGECRSGGESGSGTAHDPATHTAICSQNLGDTALVPLSPGAHHDAVDMGQVWSTMAEGALPGDRCYCVGTIGEAIAVGWRAELGYGAPAVQESLAAFPVDGRLPVLVSLQAERPQATTLGPNAFTFTARNPNSGTALLDAVEFALGGDMLYQPGTTSGLTTADPSVSEGLARWTGPFPIRAHDAATLRFGVTHGADPGTVVASAFAFPVAGWWAAGPAEPDGIAEARVAVGPGEARAPDTRITAGPGAATRDPRPAIAFAADLGGATFECRLGESAFAPCSSPEVLGPLADGSYAFAVRARAGGFRDGTPATRQFRVDTLAPNTRIISGPRPVSNDATPMFEMSAGEPDAELECRIDAGAFAACASPYTSPPLADGAHVFAVRAVDAAGNADASPASRAFTVDTVAPDTAFDDGQEVAARLTMTAGRRDIPVVGDGPALRVDCPAEASSSCSGTVTVATSTALVAVEPFTAAPGTTVPVEPTLPGAVQNEVEREGRVGVTLIVSTTTATDAQPLITTQGAALTPDPRTAWLRDAGTEIELHRGAASLRLTCSKMHSGPCRGEVILRDGSGALSAQTGARRGLGAVRFAVRRSRSARVRLQLTPRGRRLVRRAGGLRVAATVRTRRRSGRPVTKRRSLIVTAPGGRR